MCSGFLYLIDFLKTWYKYPLKNLTWSHGWFWSIVGLILFITLLKSLLVI